MSSLLGFLVTTIANCRCKSFQGGDCDRPFDQRVEYAASEPNALALRATVDFDALAVASRQSRVGAVWASHCAVLTRAAWNVLNVESHVLRI